MVAELEDTSYRRTQSVAAPLSDDSRIRPAEPGPEAHSSPKSKNPRGTYRHSLPTVLDEPFRRHMKTWHFDEPTRTWRPHSPTALRVKGAKSHPDLLANGHIGDEKVPMQLDDRRDCPTVLLAELSTNVELQSDAFVIQNLSGHLSTSFPGISSTVVISIQRPQSMWINGQASPCSVLKIHIPRRSDPLGVNQRSINSTRHALANLLATPIASTFIIFNPMAGPSTRPNGEVAESALAKKAGGRLSKIASWDRFQVSDHGPISVNCSTSKPQGFSDRIDSMWSTNGRGSQSSPGGLPRRESPPSPRSMQPFHRRHTLTNSSYPIAATRNLNGSGQLPFHSQGFMASSSRPRSSNSTLASGTQPRSQNTFKKRNSYSGARLSSLNSVRALSGFASRPRNQDSNDRSRPGPNDTLRPARPVTLTTSRTTARTEFCPIPEHVQARRKPPATPQTTSVREPCSPPKDGSFRIAPNEGKKQRSRLVTAVNAYIKKNRAAQSSSG